MLKPLKLWAGELAAIFINITINFGFYDSKKNVCPVKAAQHNLPLMDCLGFRRSLIPFPPTLLRDWELCDCRESISILHS